MTRQSPKQSLRFSEQFYELAKTDIGSRFAIQPRRLSSILRGEMHDKALASCMDIREVFVRNLRKARNAKGLSQEALAHEAEVDRTYVSALERSQYSASIDMVDRLAKALEVEASALLQRPARSRPRRA